mmetsp:Transcript_18966/g.51002  ORF Transcript_18966/g.51002 Transcript_18966/m.51002 type:complete len:108 (+) Transcript_18966:87-410(+)|eukprot:CAMPEP_0185185098 /NCGR_PEP_ID=MMETSP1140-20130426/3006_1 /TAXON_ID=298111 /ORGANISM="Pavlova sp., Strain CCMP459" /LENGTH=107 /DNA_ID=CAMNT_0027751225 /DNA_START=73 /DNA_END=396 /DNA_ORIENTATION=-
MPLVKIFALRGVKPLPVASLQASLCNVWGTKPNTTKLMVSLVDEWTSSGGEDVFVDVRAKKTPDRTRDAVMAKMQEVQVVFKDHGYKANVRLETYEADSYFHLLPSQ